MSLYRGKNSKCHCVINPLALVGRSVAWYLLDFLENIFLVSRNFSHETLAAVCIFSQLKISFRILVYVVSILGCFVLCNIFLFSKLITDLHGSHRGVLSLQFASIGDTKRVHSCFLFFLYILVRRVYLLSIVYVGFFVFCIE